MLTDNVAKPPRKVNGFTLIELVVVVIIIAILAAIAVPKFQDRTTDARAAATRQSLYTLRSAVEFFNVDNGAYPNDLQQDLTEYLQGAFPETQVGGAVSDAVRTVSSEPISASDVDDTGGWLYNPTTGEVRINHSSAIDF